MEQQATGALDAKALAALMNAIYAGYPNSPTQRAIFRKVYGDDYPEEVVPFSYITVTLLRRTLQEISIGSERTFVDLGCGCGGPGLWVAREAGAALVGIDLSSVTIEQASRRAKEFNIDDRARFEVGDLTALHFADRAFDAAMSVDALWLVYEKRTALYEVARILKPGARFVFTNWERDLSPSGFPAPLGDYRPLLRETGFEIEVYEKVPNAEQKRRATYERYLAHQVALEQEMSQEAAQALISEAQRELGLIDGTDYFTHSRRIFVVARRK